MKFQCNCSLAVERTHLGPTLDTLRYDILSMGHRGEGRNSGTTINDSEPRYVTSSVHLGPLLAHSTSCALLPTVWYGVPASVSDVLLPREAEPNTLNI